MSQSIQELYQAAHAALMALGEALNAVDTPPPGGITTPAPLPDVLSQIDPIGTLNGDILGILIYQDKRYLVQLPQTNGPKQVVFRGINVTNHPDVKQLVPYLFERLSGGNTGNGGLDQPDGLPTFEGYAAKTYPDGGKYFEYTGKSNSQPAEEVPGTPVEQNTTPIRGAVQPDGDPELITTIIS